MANIDSNTYQQLHTGLDNMIKKYSDNEYVSSRLQNYMDNMLPSYLEAAFQSQLQREKRKIDLSNASDIFIKKFLLKTRFYYTPHNELFLNYDGQHFTGYSEDDIQHTILSQVSATPDTAEENLRPWKHKINKQIIRLIKERSPLEAIPDSATIQFVLKMLHPNIISSRNHAKYFLTVIGDCLRNVNKDLIYVASPVMKKVVREINVQIHTYFGHSNSLNAIKFKHYEHDYTNSRLLFIGERSKSLDAPFEVSKHAVDFLCVATHYSKRYTSADGFLKQCTEMNLVNHSLYLHNNTPESIVDTFLKTHIQHCSHAKIEKKNMVFIWKKFLESINIPNVIFYDSLMNKFKEKLSYDETNESFVNVTSSLLPVVSSFLSFWDENMVEDHDEPEIEIDEISTLFKKWTGKSFGGVEDEFLIELIRHFYPDIAIEEDKYVFNVMCKLWDKRQSVIDSLELYKNESVSGEGVNEAKSLYQVYDSYTSLNMPPLVVSKRYFEKIAKEYLGEFLDEDGLISPNW